MNCKNILNRLLSYLDNELAASEKQAVEIHLTACSTCQKELEALTATRGMINQTAETVTKKTAPPWIWFELRQRLDQLSKTRPGIPGRVLSRIKASVSGGPIWKPAMACVLTLIVFISVAWLIAGLIGPSPEALASNIVCDSPEVRALARGEPQVDAAKVSGDKGYVLTHSASGEANLALVDLAKGSVVRVFVISLPPLTEEEKITSGNIARSDQNIQRILDNGGKISPNEMFPLPPVLRLEIIDGQPVVWSEGILVGTVLRVNNLVWVARINLGEGEVMDVSMVTQLQGHVRSPEAEFSREKLVEITKTDAFVTGLLDMGAEVTHAGIGRGKMANTAAVILKLNEEIWSVRIDLDNQAVTSVELIPRAKHGKANIFSPGLN
ncbi:MAG TPA: zf-HC2 domain-containing protein [Dehalococcoidales bacterium]|nr:zf-HC2 domain-containing protein [Dehalococcoidales bacterium]